MHLRNKLVVALNKIPAQRVTGLFYRSMLETAVHSLLPPQPLYSLGPRQTGQRFTPKNGPACLYISKQFDVSFIETHGTTMAVAKCGYNFTPQPTVIIAISVDVEVLDLTLPENRKALGTSTAELVGSWFEQMISGQPVPTHILARVAYSSNRFQAIQFYSAQRPGAINLMVWTKKLKEPYFIEVQDQSHKLYQRIPPR